MPKCNTKIADGTRCRNMANDKYGNYCGTHKNLYLERESAQKTKQIKHQASEIKKLKKKVNKTDVENTHLINPSTGKSYSIIF